MEVRSPPIQGGRWQGSAFTLKWTKYLYLTDKEDREGQSPSFLALYLPGGPAFRSILAKSLSVTPLHISQTLLTASSLYLASIG